MAGAGLKVFAAAVVGAIGGGAIAGGSLLMLEIVEIGTAIAATGGIDVKLDERRFFVSKNPQQEATQLLARRATQTIAAPDIAQRMLSRIALGDQLDKLRGKCSIAAQCAF